MRRSVDLTSWRELPDATQFTIKEVAEILRVSPNQVRNAIREGFLRAFQLKAKGRGTYRVEKRDLEEYLGGCLVGTPSPDRKRPPRISGGRLLTHLEPTWLPGSSPRPASRSQPSGGRNARSRGGSSGRGGRR